MKKLYLLLLITCTLLVLSFVVSGQPKLVGTLAYDGQKFGGYMFRLDLPNTTPNEIYTFDNTAPHRPVGGVIAANDDWLYGRITYAAQGQYGGLYKIRRDGTGFTLVTSFSNPVGNVPLPVYHTDGYVYFTNEFNLLKVNTATNGITSYPVSGEIISRNLLIDDDDWLYGTTSINRLIKVKTDGTAWTDLYLFNEATEGNVGLGVTEIPGDSLFGVQQYGGVEGGGTIYSIKKDGTAFAVHHQFTSATGTRPQSKLIYFDGRLFGITSEGGGFNAGVLFTINVDGSGYRVLHHFEMGTSFTGGLFGNISMAGNGRIFGSFYQFYNTGTFLYRLFKIDSSGANFEPFFNIYQRDHGNLNQDILLINDENIYLINSEMGRHDGGVLSYTDTSGFANSLYQFGQSLTGFRPRYGLIKGRTDGKLYGVATIGGVTGNGVIYSVNQDGSGFFKLHEFADNEGYEPSGKLLEASDGKLYGVLQYGGPSNAGAVYRIDKNGSNFQVIHSFSDLVNGYWPRGYLVEDQNGVLYGVTTSGLNDRGGVYHVNKDGTGFLRIKDFPLSGINSPAAGLYLRGEYLYGTCTYGNPENKGGIFRIKKNGDDFQVLHSFSGPTDGANCFSSLILATNGKLYGNTTNGGANGYGAVFSLDTTGSNYGIVRDLDYDVDGAYPQDQLIQASDGALYGTTVLSGINPGGQGTIFKFNLDGTGFSVVHEFSGTGQFPYSLLDLNGMRALPVELFTFNALKKDKTVLVNWKTSREQNSSHFEVERAADGNKFISIGTVNATGNSNAINSYSFTDQLPLKGNNFYRLKLIDADGSFAYSKIVSLNFNNTGSVVISPNPARDRLHVQLPAGHTYTMLTITDVSGRQFLKKAVAPATTGLYLDIEQLPPGVYVLQLGEERIKFLKQ